MLFEFAVAVSAHLDGRGLGGAELGGVSREGMGYVVLTAARRESFAATEIPPRVRQLGAPGLHSPLLFSHLLRQIR